MAIIFINKQCEYYCKSFVGTLNANGELLSVIIEKMHKQHLQPYFLCPQLYKILILYNWIYK